MTSTLSKLPLHYMSFFGHCGTRVHLRVTREVKTCSVLQPGPGTSKYLKFNWVYVLFFSDT
jgi:hypothetical protein